MMALPLGALAAWIAAVDFHRLFYVLMATIPFSIELSLPGGFMTDFPSEQMMWLMMFLSIYWFAQHFRELDSSFLRHPITLFLLVQLTWMGVTVITSTDLYVSGKSYAAKGWYVIVFYFLSARVLRSERDFRQWLWWFMVPLILTVVYVVYQHALLDFDYLAVNFIMGPFYRNHVMYACIQVVFLPFMYMATYWYRRWSGAWWFLILGMIVLLVGINFAFTRAAYVALFCAFLLYWVIRWRGMKIVLVTVSLLAALFIGYVLSRDNWLRLAPDYQRTITHRRFDNLLEATIKLEDISTMERVYRWVAAGYMISEHPVTGFGPATFVESYKNYTVSSFRTYVSDNPERSGMHNYYLMLAVEQGIPGSLLFIALSFFAMLYAERIYHQTKTPWRKGIVLSAAQCFILIDLTMLMNDFIETDKIGSLFYMSLAMLVNADLANREEA